MARWPDAGIGIVRRPSGFVVIDVDGEEGREAFREHPGPFPLTTMAVSGREGFGMHLWYRVPPGRRVPRGRLLAPGLELKGAGNLVVAPRRSTARGAATPGTSRRRSWRAAATRWTRSRRRCGCWRTHARGGARARSQPRRWRSTGRWRRRYGAKAMREELDRLARAPVGRAQRHALQGGGAPGRAGRRRPPGPAEPEQRVGSPPTHAYRGAEPPRARGDDPERVPEGGGDVDTPWLDDITVAGVEERGDLLIADRFVRECGEDFRFAPGLGWLHWTGAIWQRCEAWRASGGRQGRRAQDDRRRLLRR